MSKFLDKVTESLWKKQPRLSEDEMMHAFLERVALEHDESVALQTADPERRKEEGFRIYVKRMRSVMKDAEITTEDMIKSYPAPLKAILLMRFLEKEGEKRSVKLAEKINEAGFKFVQNDVWILPPSRTPQDLADLATEQDIKQWVYENLTKEIYKDVQYVLPFVAVIDLRRTTAIRKGVLRKYTGNTIFNVMEMEEMLPPGYIYSYMKDKGLGVEDVVRRGDLVFLSTPLSDASAASDLREKRRQVTERLCEFLNKTSLSLSDITNVEEWALTNLLNGLVSHPDGVAHRLIIEAKYWERYVASKAE